MCDWSGVVPALAQNGQPTGLILKKGDVISIVANGWVKYGYDDNMLSAPQGSIHQYTETRYTLIAKIGNNTYKVGNGVLHKTVPVDGELILIFSDDQGRYFDNSGNFLAEVKIESRYSPLQEIK
ncbi:LecA/PA-IL family lectin [Xenorhabdus thuongxuanensis]|uniref:Lectin n=1 Tax=Xenorhabdus thuongxuanensis TaxID=1873484 RepID=A0A1Q5U7T6_9GAMM|nr:LecA/PA-IL family lectin [Xenorhabdus thuongxuanensis]OKP08549.1 lectin [Xenorhabdus thuongxuanensis]